MTQTLDTKSHWIRTAALPAFGPIGRDVSVDVAIVGGGLVGITTAYLLKMAGLTVALLERGTCAATDTGHTTAHLTYVTDELITDLVNNFGRDTAAATWDAGRVAIETIERHVAMEGIECGFRRVPGYLHQVWTGGGLSTEALQEQADAASALGFAAEFAPRIRPGNVAGVQYANQALFHPRKYLAGLLGQVEGDGSYVFEHSAVDEVSDDPLTVTAGGHTVSCGYVVLATHTPRTGKSSQLGASLLQSKLAPYTSYALGGRLPAGSVAAGLYWDTADPYHYLRVEPCDGYDYAVFGGADHKTGQEPNPVQCWTQLEAALQPVLTDFHVTERWSGQVIETNDGLPYIGENADRQFVATGFAGNGMTFGTLAALMARDAVLGRSNPWRDLFDPRRTSVRAGAWDYLKENKDFAYYMLRDRVFARHSSSLRSVRPGEGKVLHLDGARVAAYRDPRGVVTLCSAACTHMDCEVHFNNAETSWDCPCHGSRFRVDGSVIAGPAERPLPPHGEQS